jgi:energy-coupling factor transport system permease protein
MTNLNPTCKFLSILLAGIILSVSYKTKTNVAVFLIAIILTLSTRGIDYRRLWLNLVPFVLAALGFFMTGLFFAKNGPEFSGSLGHSNISVSSLATACQLASRVLAFGSMAILFSLTTEPEAFFQSLRQQLKLSAKFTYSLIAAYHFWPVVKSEYDMVKAASMVRGIKLWPLSPRLIIPMLVRAFRRSECLAMAMESRGFNPLSTRGEAVIIPLHWGDALFLCLPFLVLI